MATDATHGVVLLAAGGSRRLGSPKQLLRLDGETLVRRAARLALGTDPVESVVVLGAEEERVRKEVEDLDLRVLVCESWAEGMGASLTYGLGALSRKARGALVVLCDQPALDLPHLLALRDRFRGNPERAVASGYAGTVGVPAVLPRSWFPLLAAEGRDHGARVLFSERAAETDVIVNEALGSDVDRAGDLLPYELRAD